MEQVICRNPEKLPETYTANNGQIMHHPKNTLADDEDGLCWLCRAIQNDSFDNEGDDVDETDYSAEDDALAYERLYSTLNPNEMIF